MKVLVAFASKHGSTREVAQAIADELRAQGVETDLHEASNVGEIAGYDGVILGSAVYMGRWLEQARELVARHAVELAERPVWLFSSGPIGGKPLPEEAVDVSEIMETIRARAHQVLAGKLDKHKLGFGERAVVLALRVPEGDFRDWELTRQWARGIATELHTLVGRHPDG